MDYNGYVICKEAGKTKECKGCIGSCPLEDIGDEKIWCASYYPDSYRLILFKFKIGDRVKILSVEKEGIIIEVDNCLNEEDLKYKVQINNGNVSYYCCIGSLEFISRKGEVKMNKYREIKSRIDGLGENCTLKEVDDILREIYNNSNDTYYSIDTGVRVHSVATDEQEILIRMGLKGTVEAKFNYNSQCEKFQATKKAILWLLDKSNLKKDNLEEIYKISSEILELEEGILQLQYDRRKLMEE